MNVNYKLTASELIGHLKDTRKRLLELIDDLSDEQLTVPLREIVNPFLWEIGHVAFFYDVFALCQLEKTQPIIKRADELYDSFQVMHDDRWSLKLLDREATLDYMEIVQSRLIERLDSHEPDARETYLYLLSIIHEDMHCEAITYMRQTLEYSKPRLSIENKCKNELLNAGPLLGDVEIPGGMFRLGPNPDAGFVFDNEKWGHMVEVAPFKIARAPVTNGEFAEFVDAGGYENESYWSYSGSVWLSESEAKHPVYWQRKGNQWLVRDFDTYYPIKENAPIVHVNWHEAEAYTSWANRRLPTEAEWEFAASAEPSENDHGINDNKRIYPWKEEIVSSEQANIDSALMGCADVSEYISGESAFGCRQMIGNVWEWTSSAFYPYPGYIVDSPYKEYSAPWFGYRKVLRGGCWATSSRLIRNTYRNFFLPDRRDIFAGFRTCAK